MNNRHLVWIWGILICMAMASGIYLLIPDKTTAPENYPTAQTAQTKDQIAEINSTSTLSPKTEEEPIVSRTFTPNTPSSTTETKKETANAINISIEINGQTHSLTLAEKSTAYDAMLKLVNDKKINIVFKEFSGLGHFVDEINGTKTDTSSGTYWIYYLNGQSAQVGISQYILKNNDLITWKYTHSI